jgi:hypothetical protein
MRRTHIKVAEAVSDLTLERKEGEKEERKEETRATVTIDFRTPYLGDVQREGSARLVTPRWWAACRALLRVALGERG